MVGRSTTMCRLAFVLGWFRECDREWFVRHEELGKVSNVSIELEISEWLSETRWLHIDVIHSHSMG